MSWQALQPAELGPLHPNVVAMAAASPEVAQLLDDERRFGNVFMNDIYTVFVRDMGKDGAGGRVIWLSIKRNDRETCHDWRDFQRIKNELCGPEAEGVELYPAESRVVDTSNQYHLWVFTKAKIEIGWPQGYKMTPEQAEAVGAKQREGA